jgi:hypothetical protein
VLVRGRYTLNVVVASCVVAASFGAARAPDADTPDNTRAPSTALVIRERLIMLLPLSV